MKALMQSKGQYIRGQWQQGNGPSMASQNPANEADIWQGKQASEAQTDSAVAAAAQALIAWSHYTVEERLSYLTQFIEAISTEAENLATTIAMENGKPLWDSQQEMGAALAKLPLSAQAYQQRTGAWSKNIGDTALSVHHKPHGVLAVLSPFNFPVHLPLGQLLPALLAGNTVVLKPSELTPRSAEELLVLWDKLDLPPGVLNLVQGDHRVAQQLLRNNQTAGVLFTGGVKTGQTILRQLAAMPEKLVALELGGNNPQIVWEVEDKQAAAVCILQSAFITAGQRCTCARRLIIEQGDPVLGHLQQLTQKIIVDSYDTLPEPFMGPVIKAEMCEKILTTQSEWLEQGGQIILEASRLDRKGYFISPGIIDVTLANTIKDAECFGPLLQVIQVSTFEDALRVANDTAYGLVSGVISDNVEKIQHFKQAAKAGVLAVNRPTSGASGEAPFGGVGISGNFHPAGFYAADYCAYPVACQQEANVSLPSELPPGLAL